MLYITNENEEIYYEDLKKLYDVGPKTMEQIMAWSRRAWDDEPNNGVNYFGMITGNRIFIVCTSQEMPPFDITCFAYVVINLRDRKYLKHRNLENYDKIPVSDEVMQLFYNVRRYTPHWDGDVGKTLLREEFYL